ncbi:ribonuclease III [Gonapodya prolifera JEL478]|uniref:Large ribosomal subunit protein mL44 n=1 Tax=Gonapodya prolifera (strain JEL478) TaxID=1344416 RepID=A0A139AEB4_GONPJ|nr:ribonuclease III [Gonapodya prolifera JEL478]|eukprot:KXS15100.1 ribonuclease III [Gonapodya prolifera JEL478]
MKKSSRHFQRLCALECQSIRYRHLSVPQRMSIHPIHSTPPHFSPTRNSLPNFALDVQKSRKFSNSSSLFTTPSLDDTLENTTHLGKWTPALEAFAARIDVVGMNPTTLYQALTHKSFTGNPKARLAWGGDRLRLLGDSVLRQTVLAEIFLKYPDLPAESLESVLEAYTGPTALASVGRTLGIPNVMRWKGSDRSIVGDGGRESRGGESFVVGRVLQALIGAIFSEKGEVAAQTFIKGHILSRTVDVSSHLDLSEPKRTLAAVLKSKGREPPVSRLLKESGRATHSPVFLVGVYSGVDKLGEAYGTSIKMAETKAAKQALLHHFGNEAR